MGSDLLADLEAAGLTLERDGERLLVSPAEAITPELATRIRKGKPVLMTALAVRQAMEEARPAIVEEIDQAGESVRLVERTVLVWPDGEAMAFDPEFVRWWKAHNAEAARAREAAESRRLRGRPRAG